MTSDQEWEVLYVRHDGRLERYAHGSETRFSLARAQHIARVLGPPWVVNHFHTLVQPDQHEGWLAGLAPEQRQAFEQRCVAETEPHGRLIAAAA